MAYTNLASSSLSDWSNYGGANTAESNGWTEVEIVGSSDQNFNYDLPVSLAGETVVIELTIDVEQQRGSFDCSPP